ncbi:MAG: YggU family protein [Rhodocyclaceae bacterium]|nr:YggU family protein [Rhodocyclaceae bacterium]
MDWLRETGDGDLLLTLHIQPNARRTEFCGLHGEALKLRLAAPPVDGKANAALLAFIADFCALPKGAVTLASGAGSRAKRVRIQGGDPALRARLAALA